MSQKVWTKPPPPYQRILAGYFSPRKVFLPAMRLKGTGDWYATYTVSGHGYVRSDNTELVTKSGDFLLLKPGTPHLYGASTSAPWVVFWAHFQPLPAWHSWMQWPEPAPGILMVHCPSGDCRQTVECLLKIMYTSSLKTSPLKYDMAINALGGALLRCASLLDKSVKHLDQRIQKALHFLEEHVSEPFSLQNTARFAGLSHWRLSHVFHETVKCTPRQFHEQLRMERAKQLLRRTNLSIAEIAHSLGFDSEFYFSKRFKHTSGKSPQFYRKDFA